MLSIVERHLARTGIPATRFGLDAANDRSLVRTLRGGRELRPDLERRVRAFIAASDPHRVVRDPNLRLARALAERAHAPIALVDSLSREWLSPTFLGHRHRIRFEAGAAAAARMCAGWEEHAFMLIGHIVVDLGIAGWSDGIVTVEALTVVLA
ncbi:hypothetical protein [Sphingomonas nostoxanthinifaciens]|uniref:hypothetical protein n=1 Tax=Sphingomonas nostoxanthinifaciens TaxID=2872652 RepID=UPI001CC20447|nr:hypothetical protein [Sphingomonas nostoxanthinifaciens]UAK24629.1 hypothetical protein K8P63_20440 [Sphingomonas nostoxanthinifaciens]